ncbi:uncharacterized protein [Triticum aestivum]|uniref:uncharacterized protein isoform X1 n=1 Tax=Triticum aestivum TaxID=4565 RepID=UPI001D010FE6|nr:uncharacterized protein LOC123059361 isoform X1 [Triticum aestivum]
MKMLGSCYSKATRRRQPWTRTAGTILPIMPMRYVFHVLRRILDLLVSRRISKLYYYCFFRYGRRGWSGFTIRLRRPKNQSSRSGRRCWCLRPIRHRRRRPRRRPRGSGVAYAARELQTCRPKTRLSPPPPKTMTRRRKKIPLPLMGGGRRGRPPKIWRRRSPRGGRVPLRITPRETSTVARSDAPETSLWPCFRPMIAPCDPHQEVRCIRRRWPAGHRRPLTLLRPRATMRCCPKKDLPRPDRGSGGRQGGARGRSLGCQTHGGADPMVTEDGGFAQFGPQSNTSPETYMAPESGEKPPSKEGGVPMPPVTSVQP